jgi:hypothetical protein
MTSLMTSRMIGPAEPVDVAALVAAARRRRIDAAHRDRTLPEPGGREVLVVAAHSGAGASTVAVAVADAAADLGVTGVRLVDLAPADRSGLLAVSDREVDAPLPGWRAGRRGPIEILRTVRSEVRLYDLPPQRGGPDRPRHGLTVIDAGFSPAEVCRDGGGERALVVVCRPTIPGAGQAELLLAEHPAALVVVVGARRWPRAVSAALGPHVSRADDAGRLVFIPRSADLEMHGVAAEALPRGLVAAAARLVERIWAEPAEPTMSQRAKGRR